MLKVNDRKYERVESPLFCVCNGVFMKAKKEDIINTVSKLAEPICNKLGLILYDVDFYKEGADYNLCILIDKPGGVYIDDCENVSKALDPILDDADPIDCQYCLEVSSCGADRKLTRPSHYDGAIGEKVRLGFFKQIDGAKFAVGILKAYNGETVTLQIGDDEKQYSMKDVSNAKIDIDYDALFANNGKE